MAAALQQSTTVGGAVFAMLDEAPEERGGAGKDATCPDGFTVPQRPKTPHLEFDQPAPAAAGPATKWTSVRVAPARKPVAALPGMI